MLHIRWKGIIHSLRSDTDVSINKKLVFTPLITALSITIFSIPMVLGILKLISLNRRETSDIKLLLLADLMLLIIAFLILFPLHEVLHAIAFPKDSVKELRFYSGRKFLGEFSLILTCDTYVSKNRMIAILLFPNVVLGVLPYSLWMSGLFDHTIVFSKLIGFLILVLFAGVYSDLNSMMHILFFLPKNANISAQLTGFYYKDGEEFLVPIIVTARLIELQGYDYKNYAAGKGIAINQPFYEATFQVESSEERLNFQISPVEASVLALNESGTLKYKRNKYNKTLISFSDKIAEIQRNV